MPKIDVIKDGVRKLKLFSEIDVLPVELDWEYILDEKNLEKIEANNLNRKGLGDIRLVVRARLLVKLIAYALLDFVHSSSAQAESGD